MTVEIVVPKAWASLSRKIIAKSASVWTRTLSHQLVVMKNTRATATAMTITTTPNVTMTVEIVARKAWASLSRKIIAKSASVWTRTQSPQLVEMKNTRATA